MPEYTISPEYHEGFLMAALVSTSVRSTEIVETDFDCPYMPGTQKHLDWISGYDNYFIEESKLNGSK